MQTNLIAAAAIALATTGAHAQLRGPGPLNDTGVTQCVAADGSVTSACSGSGQDAAFGRDVAFADDADGHAGFQFKKISATGTPLPVEAPAWHCVADRVSGLVWDVSTRGADHHGWSFVNNGSGTGRDAGRLVAEANARQLCGASNWRLPTITELQGIVDDSVAPGTGPMVDTRFFKNARATWYWSSTPYAPDPNAVWSIDFGFIEGGDGAARNDFDLAVRLVHDDGTAASDPASRYTYEGDEVWDHWTQLVWRRCAEGQRFDGSTCKGSPTLAEWMPAVAAANSEAARTGLAWRLPNPKELSSIMDRTRPTSPAMDPVVFPGIVLQQSAQAYYWTSSALAANPVSAWTLDIRGGFTQSFPTTLNPIAARLVRDMPAGV